MNSYICPGEFEAHNEERAEGSVSLLSLRGHCWQDANGTGGSDKPFCFGGLYNFFLHRANQLFVLKVFIICYLFFPAQGQLTFCFEGFYNFLPFFPAHLHTAN